MELATFFISNQFWDRYVRLIHIQADEIRVKAQRKVLWLAMAIMVSTRLWLGAVVNEHRGEGLIRELVGLIRASALARPLLICVDGLRSYVTAVQAIFRSPLPARKKGRPRLLPGRIFILGE